MNLIEKLNLIRKENKIEKETNKNLGYKAFTIYKLHAELNPLLIKYGIGLTMTVTDCTVTPVPGGKDKYGNPKNNYLVCGTANYELINQEDTTERLKASMLFTGMNSQGDPSKSAGNAASYAYKYLWVTLLGLTDETSDVDSTYYNADIKIESAVPDVVEQVQEAGGQFKDKDESKAACEVYIKALEDLAGKEPTAINKAGLAKRLVDAETKSKTDERLLTYEKSKIKKKIAEIREDWEIIEGE